MEDPLARIRSLAADHAAHEAELRSSFLQLNGRITEAMAGADVVVSSDHTVFERYGDDESIYGYLSYERGELSVAYRSTESDVMDYVHQDVLEQTYSIKAIKDCSFKWLRAISEAKIIESFFEHMIATLEQQRTDAANSIRHLGHALSVPVRDAEAALEAVARQLGYDDVIADWRRAQASLYVDPRDAVTRASSLIETVCKHVLVTKGASLPSDQAIQGLLKATFKVLDLAPEAQPTSDLRNVSGGIISVVHGLGALRTHAGTAHGHAAGGRAPTYTEARLAVNLAGAVSTFLMEAARPHAS